MGVTSSPMPVTRAAGCRAAKNGTSAPRLGEACEVSASPRPIVPRPWCAGRGARPPPRRTSRHPARRRPGSASRASGRRAPAGRRSPPAGPRQARLLVVDRNILLGAASTRRPGAPGMSSRPVGQLEQDQLASRAGGTRPASPPDDPQREVELGRRVEAERRQSSRRGDRQERRQGGGGSPIRRARASGRGARSRSPQPAKASASAVRGTGSSRPSALWSCLRRCRNAACTSR